MATEVRHQVAAFMERRGMKLIRGGCNDWSGKEESDCGFTAQTTRLQMKTMRIHIFLTVIGI